MVRRNSRRIIIKTTQEVPLSGGSRAVKGTEKYHYDRMGGLRHSKQKTESCYRQSHIPITDSVKYKKAKNYGGIAEHGYDYIRRGTQYGVENYFNKSVFDKLKFKH